MPLKKNLTFATLLCLLISPSVWASDAVGKVIAIKGSPFILRILDKLELKMDDEVQEGDTVKSRDNESLTIELNNGHRIFVLPSTTMKIKSAQKDKTMLEQETGSMWYKVKKLDEEQSFQVRTPTAVAGVRGTGFITMVIDPNTTDLCVCEGEVEVTSAGVTRSIVEGDGSVIKRDQAPSASRSNKGFIFQPRRLSRKPACMGCHWSGTGSSYSEGDGDNLIFK